MITKLTVNLKLDRLIAPWYRGVGVVLMFHRVLAESKRSPWSALRGLEVGMEFFQSILDYFEKSGYHFISASALAAAVQAREIPQKFVVITFDDGYRDNFDYVAPILAERRFPWTLFLTTAFPDSELRAWWYGLGHLLSHSSVLDLSLIGGPKVDLGPMSWSTRNRLYTEARNLIQRHFSDSQSREKLEAFFETHDLNLQEFSAQYSFSWEQAKLISHSGGEIAGHTVNHPNLAMLTPDQAKKEVLDGASRIENMIGSPVKTFAYPFGDRTSCGLREASLSWEGRFEAAFTTRNGWIFPEHSESPFLLPRINVSGAFKTIRDFEARLNGLAT
ncbi:MAG: polysaccharide deacetylase family protein, partial [Proteobacteria bacterium]|nr:polysaccharide deacetylase family protein [Pseudomonadota bacterium]